MDLLAPFAYYFPFVGEKSPPSDDLTRRQSPLSISLITALLPRMALLLFTGAFHGILGYLE
jgi:hypothetical protein